MAILQTTDFNTGEYLIPKDAYTKLQSFINKYEKYYLVKLLGADLYDLFIADLTVPTPQVPQTAPYQFIFNSFYYDEDGALFESEGIKEMLKQFIYYHYMLENAYQKTVNGVVTMANEVSESKIYNGFNLVKSYNDAVDNWYSIQCYIQDNYITYPLYNGITLSYSSGI